MPCSSNNFDDRDIEESIENKLIDDVTGRFLKSDRTSDYNCIFLLTQDSFQINYDLLSLSLLARKKLTFFTAALRENFRIIIHSSRKRSRRIL